MTMISTPEYYIINYYESLPACFPAIYSKGVDF